MGAFMTNDAVKRLTKLRQGERVGGSAIENDKTLAICFENLADASAQLRRVFVFAVRSCRVTVYFFQSLPDFRANRCRVIAGEVMADAHRVSLWQVASDAS